MSLDAINKEFWGDLQSDLYVENSAVYLANRSGENLINAEGKVIHRPIMSMPSTGTYTPYSDISFNAKTAEDQTLTVDTYKYAADEIDDTDASQTPYSLPEHSSKSIRRGLMNKVEQKFNSEFANARHSISSSPVVVDSTNVIDIFAEATGTLGSFDAPIATAMRSAVLGPKTIAKLLASKAIRESGLGDRVMENGLIGPYLGYNVVQNNNLPWSASLAIGTQPTDGDTVSVAGVTFTFKTTLGSTAGNVLIGASATTARANLAAAVNGTSGAGTTYVELSNENKYLLREKRGVAATSDASMAFTGFGDISVSETLTASADVWSAQRQTSIFMVRGAIDLVLQLKGLEIVRKEAGFADIVKGMIGVGTKTFNDGATLMVKMTQDASSF